MEQYKDAVLNRYYHPNHCGTIDASKCLVGVGQAGTEQSGEVVRIQIALNPQGLIDEICFKAQGCCALVAASEWVCEQLEQQPLVKLEELSHEKIIEALQLPTVKSHSALLVLEAARDAVAALSNRSHQPPG